MGESTAPVRLRLVFEDHGILTKRQRSEGLKRSWLLLRPELSSVSDVVDHVAHCFKLQRSCPCGIVLHMEDFTLPSFESSGIFKDGDVIGVRKKTNKLKYCIENDDKPEMIEDAPFILKQPLFLCDKATEVDSVKKCSESYQNNDVQDEQNQSEENNDSKSYPCELILRKRKRKHQDNLPTIKRKKDRVNISNEQAITSVDEAAIICKGKTEDCHTHVGKTGVKRKASNEVSETVIVSLTDVTDNENGIVDTEPTDVRNDQLDAKGEGYEDKQYVNKVEKKIPSRSARRKKAKRLWLRQLAIVEEKGPIQTHLTGKNTLQSHSSEIDTLKLSQKFQKVVQNTGDVGELVPIVVRPGHIRFEPFDVEKTALQRHDEEYLEWNGTANKKKGQKWGQQKTSKGKPNDSGASCEQSNNNHAAEEEAVAGPMDFKKLASLTRMPKVGEVIAYRLLELSSSWCPEISSFRVGKIASIDPFSMNAILAPVPGFPIPAEKPDEECSLERSAYLYQEDDTLEIDFSSLIDVRLVDTSTNKGWAESVQDDSANNCAPSSGGKPNQFTKCAGSNSENGKSKDWDEFDPALNAKKSELNEKNGWGQWTEPPVPKKWSYRALRGTALGPTISRLRANKDL